MIEYQTLEQINQLHDLLHLNNPGLTKEAIQRRQPDESCTVCYPPGEIYNLYFNHFWNWFFITFPAIQYSFKTYTHFIDLLVPSEKSTESLILSIRYSEPVHLDRVAEETFQAFHNYYSFVFDPADIDIIEPSSSAFIYSTTTRPIETNLFEDTSSTSSEHIIILDNPHINYLFSSEDLNLDSLFKERNSMADAQAVLDYLRANNNNHVLRIEPFFGDGTQDPLTWFTAFVKATQVNGWKQTKATQMLAAHLQDEADDWWTDYVHDNGVDYTDGAYRQAALETAFKEKFCTQRWQNKWLKDLEGRRQGPSESVDSYYTDFKKLIKRVNLEDNMSDLQKLRHFLRGLRPEVAPLVAMNAPANVNAALILAQQYENGQDLINHEQPIRTRPE
jgi:Ty3 transposon capsid-like protein